MVDAKLRAERRAFRACMEEARTFELFTKAFRNSQRAWNRYMKAKAKLERIQKENVEEEKKED